MADHPCRIKFSLLPSLTRKTLPKVRFRRVASAQKSPRGIAVTFADGRRAFVAGHHPLGALTVAALTSLTNGLPGLLDDAIAALGADEVISRDGSFSQRFVRFALSKVDGLDVLDVPSREDFVRVADSLTRWLETTRHDYPVDITLYFDWIEKALGDLEIYIALQMNQVTGWVAPGRYYADRDGDGNLELYFVDEDGNVYDANMRQIGKLGDDDDKGCMQRAWEWLTDSGIMWGKEGPMGLPTFIAARFVDQHRPRLRALVTDVAAGQATVDELAAAARQLIDLPALKHAFIADVAPALRVGLTDLSLLRAVRLTATTP